MEEIALGGIDSIGAKEQEVCAEQTSCWKEMPTERMELRKDEKKIEEGETIHARTHTNELILRIPSQHEIGHQSHQD